MGTQEQENTVLLDRDQSLGFITLRRPHCLNALNKNMCTGLERALRVWQEGPASFKLLWGL